MPLTPALQAPAATLGRFELRRELGRGAQAVVWLAFDPRLEREVAVKLLRSDVSANAVSQWLQEARSVSRLKHPNIVPVFEADMHERQPYLVFEYVPGQTLAERLRARGKLAAREAVEMMVTVLDALRTAHDAGVIHRDLKPSNILIDESGRARVMDFGIAARMQHGVDNGHPVVGTPGYMSPEATHGLAPAPSMDLFSAGLVLAEMLSGERLVDEREPFRAMYRVAHEDLGLPAEMSAGVDDALRALLLRSLQRQAENRMASAAEFRDALQRWLTPETPHAAPTSGTLEFLLRRMRHKTDFPALSDSVARIQKVANSENESISSLSTEILKDVALTNKLLRVVNTPHYTQAGGGTISTISRAVALVGFAGIRNLALSLVLLEHMHDKAHANLLKEEFLRSLMAGSLAAELCKSSQEGEEAFIGALFHNLGRLLTEFYFAEEAGQIRRLVESSLPRADGSGKPAITEAVASHRILGLSFEELGVGIAKAWALPDNLLRCMERPQGDPPSRRPEKSADRLRWLAQAANEVTDVLLKAEPGQVSDSVARVASRYTRVLGVEPREVQAAAVMAQQRLVDLARAMNLQILPGSPVRRLLAPPGNGTSVHAEPDSLTEHALQATLPPSTGTESPTGTGASSGLASENAAAAAAAAAMLAAGIQDITNSMVEDFNLNQVLRMILETMLRALNFRHVVFCLRDAKTETLTGRLGLGEGADKICHQFKVRLKPPAGAADLFSAVCLKGADTLIADARVGNIASRLPAWYAASVNAPAFLLLPLQMKGAPFALIYADKAHAGGIELGEKELSLLRTLRNQAVMAFKQATG